MQKFLTRKVRASQIETRGKSSSLQELLIAVMVLLCLLTNPSKAHAIEDGGKSWFPLDGWSKTNNFKLLHIKRNESFALTNATEKLSFKVDSQLAAINGANVWLCDPIMPKDGQFCISALDLNTTIAPILFPRTDYLGDAIHTICLDPGHGGKDTGGIFGQYMEKRYTLPLAAELAKQLEAAGFKVILTRTNDTFIELENRPALADQQKADLFISLHFNIGPPDANGVEVYCLTPVRANSTNSEKWGHLEEWGNNLSFFPGNHWDEQNVLLAFQLQKSLIKNLPVNDRGLRRARFAVLRTATMPAVLIEGGFLTDIREQKKIADPNYRERIAQAIVQGVLNYKSVCETLPPRKNQI